MLTEGFFFKEVICEWKRFFFSGRTCKKPYPEWKATKKEVEAILDMDDDEILADKRFDVYPMFTFTGRTGWREYTNKLIESNKFPDLKLCKFGAHDCRRGRLTMAAVELEAAKNAAGHKKS